MNAQEKAIELIEKFALGGWGKEHAKRCVEEILSDLRESLKISREDGLHPHAEGLVAGSLAFWLGVKKELEATVSK